MTSITRESPISGPAKPTRLGPASRLPRRSSLLFRVFRSYARRYIKRHFHALRLSVDGPPPELTGGPLIVVTNHPSWWDPLIGLVLTEQMPSWRTHFGPIDVRGLAQYPFLERLGFFGIEPGTTRGSLAFLRQSLEILAHPEATLWITAQGHFVDPRERPIRLKSGIGHLASRLSQGTIVPLAMEYPFWNDRCPEALARFGPPIAISSSGEHSPSEWTACVEQALEKSQDVLAEHSRRRESSAFTTLIGGAAGVGGIYDSWRRLRARIRGEVFHPEHRITEQNPT